VDKALNELEQRKTQIGNGYLDLEKDIANVKKKQERLAMAFTDGTLTESVYKSKLKQLKKQEAELIKRQSNLSPSEIMEVTELSRRITAVKELLQKGKVQLTDLGFFASAGDKYVPLGFNPWPESNGKMAIGEPCEMETVLIDEESGVIIKSNLPPGFNDPDIPAGEKGQRILANWRELLRFLNIKVTIYPDHKEISGAIPPQLIMNSGNNTVGAPITSSVERDRGRGRKKEVA
jgi:hypothetical protein